MDTVFSPVINPPTHFFLEITTECNLRCKQCHLWMSKEESTSLSTDEKLELIRQYYLMNPRGTVVLSGGEPLSKPEEFFAITRLCRSVNLSVSTTTNASYFDDETIERLFTEGPDFISISLDSHKEEIHDYIRGVKGAFQQVVTAIKKIVKLRSDKYTQRPLTIATNSVIFDRNIEHCAAFLEFAKNELKIDGVLFQMLGRTFYNQGKGDHFFNKHFFKDVKAAQKHIDDLKEAYQGSSFLRTNANDLDWMKLYVENPDFIGEQVCGSHEKNLIVNQKGDVNLCFNMLELTNDKPIGNVREASLKSLWTGAFASDARELMATCRMNCGMLNCHRKQ